MHSHQKDAAGLHFKVLSSISAHWLLRLRAGIRTNLATDNRSSARMNKTNSKVVPSVGSTENQVKLAWDQAMAVVVLNGQHAHACEN